MSEASSLQRKNAETKKGNALRAFGCAVFFCAGVVGLLTLIAWIARDVIAAAWIESALRDRGVSCNELAVQSTPLMGEISLAPTSCTLRETDLSVVRWEEPLVLVRTGLRIRTVRANHVEVTRAPRATDARATAWGALGDMLHGPEQVGAVLIFASRMSRTAATPALEIGELEVVVAGQAHPEMTLSDVRAAERSAGPVDAHVQAITLAPIGAMGVSITPRMNDVTLHADATTGLLAGQLDAGPTLPLLGTISLQRRVEIVGEALDEAIPVWSVR